jgi:polar amino acid transport system substrate-binding protein
MFFLRAKVFIIICYSSSLFAQTLPNKSSKEIKKTPKIVASAIDWAFDPWKPFHHYNSKSKIASGVIVDLVKEVLLKELSLSLKYSQVPWARAQYQVKNGSSDFLVTVPTVERKKYGIASKNPIYLLENKVFYHLSTKKKDIIAKWNSIKQIKSSGIKGVTQKGDGWWKENLKGLKTEYVTGAYKVLKMLENGRADFAIMSDVEAKSAMTQYKMDSKKFTSGLTVESSAFHFLLSKKSKHHGLINKIDGTILKLKKSGRLKEIIKNFVR